MRTSCLLIFFLTLSSLISAQMDKIHFDRPDWADELEADNSEFRPFARTIDVDIDLWDRARLVRLGDIRYYGVQITAAGAEGIGLYFDEFVLPEGSSLIVGSSYGHQTEYGAEVNSDGGRHALPIVPGESVTLVFVMEQMVDLPSVKLSELAYAVRDVPNYTPSAARDFGDSESCQVNANCSEGDNWKDESRSVVRISTKNGPNLFWCTGALINNTNQDCEPYILTADHCGEDATTSDYDSWIFYFQYESPDCNNPGSEGSLDQKSLTGCTIKSRSGTYGDEDSDFMLLLLNDSVPQFYNPYFAGWDRRNQSSSSGISFHHPSGDIKKISTYEGGLTSDSWQGTVDNTHWSLTWKSTTNGHGVTEGGSSGAPLFNEEGRIIGDLTGGTSDCNAGQNDEDLFGKFSYSWDQTDASQTKQLKPFLDPTESGVETLDGINWPCLQDPITSLSESDLIHAFNLRVDQIEQAVFLDEFAEFAIFDLGGRLIKVGSGEKISISGIESGIYILNLQGGGQRDVYKIWIE